MTCATGLVLQNEVIFVVNTGQSSPVNSIHIAQFWIFLYAYGTTDNTSQWDKAKLFHVLQLVDNLQHITVSAMPVSL